ncbi:MAG: succinyldiaminopimelate transaminase [Bifidobacterium sp.]|nr:succinyldiaminopimelate transaminase [Bifidobacterium sp.]
MGFHPYTTPYDWSRIDAYKDTAASVPGGMVDLSVGSPVDPVPESVRQALTYAADEPNAHGYPATIGTAQLRAAITEWFRTSRGVDLERLGAGLVPTVGSKESVALMASLLHLGEGDVVVQPRVSYPTYEIGTQVAGARVLKVDDVADTASWKDVPGVRAVWVNSPCNPTGAVLTAAQLHGIVAAARAIGAVVLSDECYAMLTWDGSHDSPCMLLDEVCEGSPSDVLVLYSLSKQSNMAGYRTALIAGDPALVAAMTALRKQLGLIVPGPVQAAMAAGLRDVVAVGRQRERYGRRLDDLVGALTAYGYDAAVPAGGLYVWVPAKSGDCWADMAALAKLGIIASPGEFYGAPGYLRFSVTATDGQIRDAVNRLRDAAR